MIPPVDQADAVMGVMEASFDPAYGEAWNRRQLSDALVLRNTHCLIADASGHEWTDANEAAGFLLSRCGADEEELLLLAVRPSLRGRGIAGVLIERFADNAVTRRIARIFLQMREGNPAESVYRAHGFAPIGRRREYYRGPGGIRIDAITFVRIL